MSPATTDSVEVGSATEGGPDATDIVEECEDCSEETKHDVSVTIRTESEQEKNSQFSREPYRLTECLSCGRTESERLNDR